MRRTGPMANGGRSTGRRHLRSRRARMDVFGSAMSRPISMHIPSRRLSSRVASSQFMHQSAIDHPIIRSSRHAPAVLGTTSARSCDTVTHALHRQSLIALFRESSRARHSSRIIDPSLDPVSTHRHLDSSGRLPADLDVEVAHWVRHSFVRSLFRSFVRSRRVERSRVTTILGFDLRMDWIDARARGFCSHFSRARVRDGTDEDGGLGCRWVVLRLKRERSNG